MTRTEYLEYRLSDLQTLGAYHQAVVAGYLAAFEGNVPATENEWYPLDAGVRLGVEWAQAWMACENRDGGYAGEAEKLACLLVQNGR